MILITHEIDFARDIADRIFFLHSGKIEEYGKPEDVLVNPESERLQSFLSIVIFD